MRAEALLNVLLVEDSPWIRDSLTEAIDALPGYHVAGAAQTAAQAISLLAQRHFAVAVVDLQLGAGSGFDVLAHLRSSGALARTLVIVLTNHALPAYRHRCAEYGVQHFFDKSLEFDQVFDVLRGHAGRVMSRD